MRIRTNLVPGRPSRGDFPDDLLRADDGRRPGRRPPGAHAFLGQRSVPPLAVGAMCEGAIALWARAPQARTTAARRRWGRRRTSRLAFLPQSAADAAHPAAPQRARGLRRRRRMERCAHRPGRDATGSRAEVGVVDPLLQRVCLLASARPELAAVAEALVRTRVRHDRPTFATGGRRAETRRGKCRRALTA